MKPVFTMAAYLLGSLLALNPFAAGQQPESAVTTPDIPGVVAGGTRVERVWTGLRAADGLISEPDGTLLLPEQRADRISRFSSDGTITLYLEDTNEAGGIAIDAMGRLISVERRLPRVRVLAPERRILLDSYEGEPLERLSDIVADQKGGVYFTEGRRSSVYYLSPDGDATRLANDIEGANGIMLSPDERTLYVTNTPAGILAFDVRPDGGIGNRRPFVMPQEGQDGMAIDAMGRLYVAGRTGVQVFSSEGASLGVIPTPRPTTTLAFAGPEKRTLYVIGRGNDGPDGDSPDARSMYRVSMLAEGFRGRAK
jgi:gluconolactonase